MFDGADGAGGGGLLAKEEEGKWRPDWRGAGGRGEAAT
jgi:hypothetical protein